MLALLMAPAFGCASFASVAAGWHEQRYETRLDGTAGQLSCDGAPCDTLGVHIVREQANLPVFVGLTLAEGACWAAAIHQNDRTHSTASGVAMWTCGVLFLWDAVTPALGVGLTGMFFEQKLAQFDARRVDLRLGNEQVRLVPSDVGAGPERPPKPVFSASEAIAAALRRGRDVAARSLCMALDPTAPGWVPVALTPIEGGGVPGDAANLLEADLRNQLKRQLPGARLVPPERDSWLRFTGTPGPDSLEVRLLYDQGKRELAHGTARGKSPAEIVAALPAVLSGLFSTCEGRARR